ncbi:MAG: hypothetical protein COT34_00710 [Candidatus Nealsonbacteria bacterium CG08_land_8_20_14_0_20_43_11]|uniref:Uncharacterized protein n=1 Tax=Candidatus Nealsonbacteria bacterium CG08_land_8_20_14_0_20_43_11 TaxID=1974706 RepID=A0A2M6T114_9BACT|nr:MAG: hypothetical protein COT34_00710 [Candidatus Nealsonbacteria bacterium CG08_land_8_20_14_0_20_43_11]
MNPLINLAGKFNFSGINNISQKKSNSRLAKKVSLPVFDVFLFEKIINFSYRTGFKISFKNQPYNFRFFFVNDQFFIFSFVSIRCYATMP